jgi:aquaporin Z
LLFTIQVSAGKPLAPLAIGGILITLVYAGGPISGGHYNPAVSLAVQLRGKLSLHELILYWLFQLLGGYLGALVGGIVAGGRFGEVTVGKEVSTTQAFLAELVFTFILCLVVLCVATHSKAATIYNSYYGAAIGLVVAAGTVAVGPVSGAAFNPAVVLGLAITKVHMTGYTITVVVANLLGGVAAAAAFFMVAPGECSSALNSTTTRNGTVGETTPLVV